MGVALNQHKNHDYYKANLTILIKVRQYNLCSLQSLINILMSFSNRMSPNLQYNTIPK
jgi:hypothetical protein